MKSIWVPYCKTCGGPDVSRSTTSRSSALRGAADHIEHWKDIDQRSGDLRGIHDVNVVEFVGKEGT